MSFRDLCDAYDLSPSQQVLLQRLRRGSRVKPAGAEKRSMIRLVKFDLAKEIEPGVFVVGDNGEG
jgi:hypothetical protein